jgi:hypothetical protein
MPTVYQALFAVTFQTEAVSSRSMIVKAVAHKDQKEIVHYVFLAIHLLQAAVAVAYLGKDVLILQVFKYYSSLPLSPHINAVMSNIGFSSCIERTFIVNFSCKTSCLYPRNILKNQPIRGAEIIFIGN